MSRRQSKSTHNPNHVDVFTPRCGIASPSKSASKLCFPANTSLAASEADAIACNAPANSTHPCTSRQLVRRAKEFSPESSFRLRRKCLSLRGERWHAHLAVYIVTILLATVVRYAPRRRGSRVKFYGLGSTKHIRLHGRLEEAEVRPQVPPSGWVGRAG